MLRMSCDTIPLYVSGCIVNQLLTTDIRHASIIFPECSIDTCIYIHMHDTTALDIE